MLLIAFSINLITSYVILSLSDILWHILISKTRFLLIPCIDFNHIVQSYIRGKAAHSTVVSYFLLLPLQDRSREIKNILTCSNLFSEVYTNMFYLLGHEGWIFVCYKDICSIRTAQDCLIVRGYFAHSLPTSQGEVLLSLCLFCTSQRTEL